jgi:hypothetical protein
MVFDPGRQEEGGKDSLRSLNIWIWAPLIRLITANLKKDVNCVYQVLMAVVDLRER